MKVVLVNGSPHSFGGTYTALKEVSDTLQSEGISTEIFHIGTRPVSGCIACGKCNETDRCAIDDSVNVFLDKAEDSDGFVFGSPVHFAAAGGALTSFMDRAFYACDKAIYYLKPAAAVTVARRAGTTATFDQLNKYFTISEMPIVSSRYWNMVFGASAEDVVKDEEGMQCMRILARNMAYLLKCKDAAKKAGVPLPEREKVIRTNFIKPSGKA